MRPIFIRLGIAALALLAAVACWPAAALAGGKVIESAGPLNAIFVDEDLGCQLHAIGDLSLSFYGSAELGECGTFLADSQRAELWGPVPAAGVKPELYFEPEGQLTGGIGTAEDPLTVLTHVGAYEPTGELVAELAEEDSYVVGEDFYTTTIEIVNRLAEPLKGTIYHAGHCLLAGLYDSYGADDAPSPGSVACSIEPDDTPSARYMALTPVAISGSIGSPNEAEGEYELMWAAIDADGSQFADTFFPDTFAENAIGLSWPIELSQYGAGGDTAELRFATTVSPWSPPASSSSVSPGACLPTGQVAVTVSAVDGPAAVDYVVDGVPEAPVPTNAAGQATIALAPGLHTLEYWGVDEAGDQEGTHHIVTVTVASGGPSLTITSDQGHTGYNLNEAGSVTIAASGPGLTSNPSASHVPISTTTPGTYSLTRTAADACGTTTATFTYTVASTSAPLPPPALGQTVNVAPVSGKVLVALPSTAQASIAGALEGAFASANKGLHFVPLKEARQIPVGSTLEATAGMAKITTATGTKGKTQSGEFGAGIFKLLQNRKQKGLTELNIVDNRSSKQVCATVGKKAAVAAKLSSKTLGRLTGSAHGKFTTKGQYSAATVRGTTWSVANQCDGTLTKVSRGEVSVRDFHRRKTITLFSGQSYLAKA